jgi:hypothetical protein
MGLILASVATTAVAVPLMTPGPPTPFGRLIELEAVKAARFTHLQAQLAQGWTILAPVTPDHVDL